MNNFNINDYSQIDYSKLETYEVVSFDFFDTIVYRHNDETSLTRHVFQGFAKRFDMSCSVDDFIKIKSQIESSYNCFDKGAVYKLEEVYQDIFNELEKPEITSAFYRQLVRAELDNFSLTKGLTELLEWLKSNRKRVVLCSDTYYSESDVRFFLQGLNIDTYFNALYLSSECGESKASGGLFEALLNKESVLPKQLLHIGDNLFSDVKQAENKGICTCHYALPIQNVSEREVYYFSEELLAPVIAQFCKFVNDSVPTNIDIIFLGRDGFLPFQVFRKLYPQRANTHYCYLNRVIAHQLKFDCLDESLINYVTTLYKADGIWGVVSVMGLEDTEFSAALRDFIARENLQQNTLLTNEIALDIVNNHDLSNVFFESLQLRKHNAKRYLKQFGLVSGNQIVIVDIGWNASIYQMLAKSEFDFVQCKLMVSTTSPILGLSSLINYDNTYQGSTPQFVAMRELLEFCFSENIGSIRYIDKSLQPNLSQINFCNKRQFIQDKVLDSVSNLEIINERNNVEKLGQYLHRLPPTFSSYFTNAQADIAINSVDAMSIGAFLPNSTTMNQAAIKDKQANIYRFLQWVKVLSKKNIILYGAGSGADFLLPFVSNQCHWIVDINEQMHGKHIHGKEIKSIESLGDVHKSDITILVSVLGRKDQILRLLESYNLNFEFLEENF